MSYVRGAWSKEADETADRATTTYLRSKATWSGILLRYENLRDEPVVLLRVFHAPGTRTEPTALKDARIFTRGHVKLLDVKPHVEGGIDARRMSKAFPDALITTGGVLVRTRVSEIREMGRATQGVTLISVDEGSTLSGVQKILEGDEEDHDDGEVSGEAGTEA